MQFQTDIINSTVTRAKIMETTALGAAFLAGLKVGVWTSINEISKIWQSDQIYHPNMDKKQKNIYIHKWHKAIEMCKGWEDERTNL